MDFFCSCWLKQIAKEKAVCKSYMKMKIYKNMQRAPEKKQIVGYGPVKVGPL